MGNLIPKLILISEEDKEKLEKLAQEKRMTSNQLIRIIIADYLMKGK